MLSVRWDGIARVLLAVAGAALLLVLWIVPVPIAVTIMTLTGWNLLALAFLLRQIFVMRRGRIEPDSETPPDWLLPVRSMTGPRP